MSKEGEDKQNLTPMETGELQMRQAFEEVATKNINTISEYTRETRTLVRTLEERVHELKNMVAQRDKDIGELRQQLSLVQAKLYAGGTV